MNYSEQLECTLTIKNEIHCNFANLDEDVRKACVAKLSYIDPTAKYTMSGKLGRWDGKTKYFSMNGNTFVNTLDIILPIIVNAGYNINIVDNRIKHDFNFNKIESRYLADKNIKWPVGHRYENNEIILQDHQVFAINEFLDDLACVKSISTGAGKTIISATLAMLVQDYGKTVIIVPNKSLVEQTEDDYKNVGLDVGVYYGDRKDLNHHHIVTTWQSLNVMYETNNTALYELANNTICVMVDEAHGAKAPALKQILCNVFSNVPIRWGFTGTIPKNDYEYINLVTSIGKLYANVVTVKELQENNFLANCNIDIYQLNDNRKFSSYADEKHFLNTDEMHIQWLGNFISDIAKTGNTLILVNLIDTGKKLLKLLPEASFVEGKVKTSKRKAKYDAISNSDNNILIATYGTASTGINIPRLFNLIILEPGKSFTKTIQSIGRGIRRANDKDAIQVYDICSTCKYSSKHLGDRKKYYKEAQYPFKITKINYLKSI